MLKGYLAGPIANCDDAEAHDWRDFIVKRTEGKVNWHNPMDRDFRFYDGKLDSNLFNNNTEESTMPDNIVKLIIDGDKAAIDDSDFCIFNCWKPSFGTPMEMIYAWERNKIVWSVVPDTVSLSPWIRYHSTAVVTNLDVIVEMCSRLAALELLRYNLV